MELSAEQFPNLHTRTRKLKCDEGQPECARCRTAGFKCEGYSCRFIIREPNNTPITPSKTSEAAYTFHFPRTEKPLIPRLKPEELRSYQYFLVRTAPSLAGVFDNEFWSRELPRACQTSPALWHAVVSLGAIDEFFHTRKRATSSFPRNNRNLGFALHQYSTSVKYLLSPSGFVPGSINESIALAASIVYTCVCTIHGLHSQALIHLRSGMKLLEQLSHRNSLCTVSSSALLSGHGLISFKAMQSVIGSFNIKAEAMRGGIDSESLLLCEMDNYKSWQTYQGPDLRHPSSRTVVDLLDACKTAESLLNSMALFYHDSSTYALLIKGDFELIKQRQLPFRGVLGKLGAELHIFESSPSFLRIHRNAVKVLRMLFMICQMFCITGSRSLEQNEVVFTEIVELASEVLADDEGISQSPKQNMLDLHYTPKPSTSQALFLTAVAAPSPVTQNRAIELMHRYPRQEGLWDSPFSAALASQILKHRWDLVARAESEESLSFGEVFRRKLLRDVKVTVTFEAERKAKITLRTADEWEAGHGGTEKIIEW
ncbi:MAG: hypothetical protein M1820_006153 [Bogoriella megaspora]|nr:MAG: hypothetical protein M1820_006153 [Bogoriella megaspora]